MTCLQYFTTAHTGYSVLMKYCIAIVFNVILTVNYIYYPQNNYLFQPPLFQYTQSTLEGSSGDTFNFAHQSQLKIKQNNVR